VVSPGFEILLVRSSAAGAAHDTGHVLGPSAGSAAVGQLHYTDVNVCARCVCGGGGVGGQDADLGIGGRPMLRCFDASMLRRLITGDDRGSGRRQGCVRVAGGARRRAAHAWPQPHQRRGAGATASCSLRWRAGSSRHAQCSAGGVNCRLEAWLSLACVCRSFKHSRSSRHTAARSRTAHIPRDRSFVVGRSSRDGRLGERLLTG
jgi:hypothetical protein